MKTIQRSSFITISLGAMISLLARKSLAAKAANTVSVFLNEKRIGRGIEVNGVTFVPLRLVAEGMGAAISYDASIQSVNITTDAPSSSSDSSWQSVQDFDGSSTKKTDSFHIAARKWRVKWVFSTPGQDFGTFSITVHKVDSDSVSDLIANVSKPGEDTSFVYGGGDYYLDISCIGSYSITVEEYK